MFSPLTRAALLALCVAALPAWASDLTVKVTGSGSVSSVDDFVLKTTITNNGVEAVTLLNDPNSILTPQWKTDVFGIVGPHGTPAKFGGVKVKWSPKLAVANGQFTTLTPGQSLEVEHNLNGVYNLTDCGLGEYTISAKPDFKVISSSGELSTVTATIENHNARFSGKLSSSKPISLPPTATRKKAVGFASCDSAQQSKISTAAKSAQSYISSANSYLAKLDSGTERYTTWFGSYTSSRGDTIKSHFSLMNNDPLNTTYDCSCNATDTFAFVYPNQPGYIHLCGAFWNAPNTGTDSRAGTIVHESSHFTVNGGTQDHVYGQDGCKNLANSDPDQAIFNADSHEYFAENNPKLP
ncbi:hypothetical protein FRB99_006666 [Tulasnella sp. 403]|nr:hypothetical protein FRB99_006666 [Tulasnella sp. 403]